MVVGAQAEQPQRPLETEAGGGEPAPETLICLVANASDAKKCCLSARPGRLGGDAGWSLARERRGRIPPSARPELRFTLRYSEDPTKQGRCPFFVHRQFRKWVRPAGLELAAFVSATFRPRSRIQAGDRSVGVIGASGPCPSGLRWGVAVPAQATGCQRGG
jgi:hypothetical protein